MSRKKVVLGDYIDDETGLRFVEDDRGNYHLISPGQQSSNDRELKMLRRVVEALRMENNWLWGTIEKALDDDRKQSAGYAIRQLQKRVKERQRI